jgi:trehalose 6-phosphate phosphatase
MIMIPPAVPVDDIKIDLDTSAFLLDVDGTILDIAATPRDVAVPTRLKRALARLNEQTGGAVAFVSGRLISDLDRLFAPLQLPSIGAHGAELRVNGEHPHRKSEAPIDDELRGQFAAFASKLDGVIFEDKGYSLALHFRRVPQHANVVRDAVAAACAPYPPSTLEVLPGKAVIEVKSSAFNKGAGIRELMSYPPFRGRRPIFIGDDVTDESAFAVLPEFNGMGFSVGHRMPGLAGCFPRPSHVRSWIYRMAGAEGADRR